MYSLNDKVKILSNGVSGTIVDISLVNGKRMYVVESDVPNVAGGYGGIWKLFDCSESDLKLGLPIDDTLDQEDAFLSHNWHSVPFGIYTEDGFNYTNNTNTKS